MPRLKKATDANEVVFYPITISKGVYDTDRNQRLSESINELYNNKVNSDDLAEVATTGSYDDLTDKPAIPTAVQSDWNEENSSSIAYIQNKPSIPEDVGYAAVLGLANFSNASTITKTTSPEWKYVLLDSEDKVLLGVYQDGTTKAFASVGEIMDCIYSSWT